MGETFEQLRAEFLDESEDTLDRLQRDLTCLAAAASGGEIDGELVDRAFRTTHSLKGVAGMFGLDEFSSVSHAMENGLEGIRRGDLPLGRELADLLHVGLETLHRLRAEATGGEGGRAAGAARDAIRALEDHVATHARVASPQSSGPESIAEICRRLGAADRRAVVAAAREGRTLTLVTWSAEADGYESGYRDLIEGIRDWGVLHGSSSEGASRGSGRIEVHVLASGDDTIFRLLKRIGPLGADVIECEAEPLIERFEPADADPETGDATRPGGSSPGRRETPPGPGPGPGNATLRVPVDRVDRLLSELGDVMQAHLGLSATTRGVLDCIPDLVRRTLLLQSLRSLDHRIRTLREEVLRIRMVTLRPLFQKIERTVRETARATGKEARLETRGDEEELDKTIVEALLVPLVHLVRNAVDHGLESPAVRRAAGKNPEGTIRVEARPEGHQTVLEIADDGAGIDWSSVREKAIRSGLLAPGDDPPPGVLKGFLFHAGFSVRDEVTEISGRGIGLDAVRDAVVRLGGILEVNSSAAGTSFRLRIPTTLAVSRCLQVEVSGEVFLLPLGCVSSVERVRPGAFERTEAGEILIRDDTVVAVSDLGSTLGLGPVNRDREHVPAVVLGLADRRLVLLVDRLAGQHEVVVRSLGNLLPPVPGVTGCTELGDGRTVLILDPVALFAAPGAEVVAAGGAA